VRDRRTAPGEALHVLVVEPHAVRRGEARADEPSASMCAASDLSYFLKRRNCLHLGLGQVRLQSGAVLAREIAAALQEIVAAVERDGRRDRGPDQVAVEFPAVQRLAHVVEARLVRRQAQPLDPFCSGGGSASMRPGIASKKLRSATIGATTARIPASL